MNKTLLFSSIVIAGAAFGGPCAPGSLQTYINLGAAGCGQGAVSFSNFVTAQGQSGATPINPSQVLITLGGSLFLPSLQFTLNTTASAPNVLESFFRFRASGLVVGDTITLNSPVAAGDGVDTATENICPGASFSGNLPFGCPKPAVSLVTFDNATFSQLSDSTSFPATSFFDIFVDLTADGGLAGSATFNSATVQVTATPEPAPALLMMAGLATLAFRSRRRELAGRRV